MIPDGFHYPGVFASTTDMLAAFVAGGPIDRAISGGSYSIYIHTVQGGIALDNRGIPAGGRGLQRERSPENGGRDPDSAMGGVSGAAVGGWNRGVRTGGLATLLTRSAS